MVLVGAPWWTRPGLTPRDGRQWDLSGGLCLALGHCYTGAIYWKLG